MPPWRRCASPPHRGFSNPPTRRDGVGGVRCPPPGHCPPARPLGQQPGCRRRPLRRRFGACVGRSLLPLRAVRAVGAPRRDRPFVLSFSILMAARRPGERRNILHAVQGVVERRRSRAELGRGPGPGPVAGAGATPAAAWAGRRRRLLGARGRATAGRRARHVCLPRAGSHPSSLAPRWPHCATDRSPEPSARSLPRLLMGARSPLSLCLRVAFGSVSRRRRCGELPIGET